MHLSASAKMDCRASNRTWIFLACALLSLHGGTARADEILVSAAASLTDALNEIGRVYTKAHPETTVRFNFGASGALAQQILQGAPVDVFTSAAPEEMNLIQAANRIDRSTRVDFAGNRLVLIAPLQSAIKDWNDLRLNAIRHIALSNPASVPSGRYAQETLTKRGLWNLVQPKAVFGENVRQTLTYVATGDADAGLVFATDARIEKRVRVMATAISGKDHEPIVYPAAALNGAPNAPGARRFVLFLNSLPAQTILARYGFLPARVPAASSNAARPGPRPKHRKTVPNGKST